jgi:small subunit ribosomal protein S6
LRQYETIFIINPDLDESQTNDVIEGVKTAIGSGGGKVLKVDPWGKKRLAYTVKQHNDGYYVLIVFESSPEFVTQLTGHYRITELIIKHIVVQFEGDLTAPAPSHPSATQEERSDSTGARPFEDSESEDENENKYF